MVVEVNKLIANLLLAEHGVSIPEVGALRAVRRPAARLSRRRIRPAYYAVEFSSECTATSLTDAIAAAAGCDAATAQDACARWLGRTMADGVLTIRGVGVLRDKSFAVDPAFEKLLNPQGREPFVVRKPGGHWLLWAVATIAIVCGVGVCGWIVYDRWASGGFDRIGVSSAEAALSGRRAAGEALAEGGRTPEEATAPDAAEEINGSRADGPVRSAAGSREGGTSATAVAGQSGTPGDRRGIPGRTPAPESAGATGEVGTNAPALSPSETAGSRESRMDATGVSERAAGRTAASGSARTVEAPAIPRRAALQGGTTDSRSGKAAEEGLTAQRLTSARTYVVLGVYSTVQNARRAARQVPDDDPALQPALYFYGPKFMLSVFSSDDAAACAAFVRAHAARFPDAWCYTAR